MRGDRRKERVEREDVFVEVRRVQTHNFDVYRHEGRRSWSGR